ncbi:MAG: phosphate transport system regulatory protein PhoU [Zetaproteobacteria bacterium CG2_30_46_52]|nr:MAG: phosphate transport system regulatory protein PhoU [Zetaproteobacteria bacterium CG2_30_46_52]
MEHTLKRFDEELEELKNLILAMGGMVERAIADAIESMLTQNVELATQTVERDKAINALEVQCDELTRAMLVRRQPAAGDLRLIMAIIKLVTDLERMGDLAAGIAKGMIRAQDNPPRNFSNIEVMGEKVVRQVNRALDAFSRGDIDLAMKVIKKDSGIDEFYKRMYREMITYMMEDPRMISNAIILTNVGKNLERISDHATNIAEMVIYSKLGHDIRHVDHDAAKVILAGDLKNKNKTNSEG